MNNNKISSLLGLKTQVFKFFLNQNIKRAFKMAESKSNADSKNDTDKDYKEAGEAFQQLARLFGYFKIKEISDEERKKMTRLRSLDFNGIANYMRECKNIIFMSGAGISTSAGIPDFRSPKTGLYQNLEKYNLPYPEAIFSLDFFKQNPEPFFLLSKELMPSVYKPTVCHYFQKLLVDQGKVLKIYTQNIDALENVAKIPTEKIVYAHGSFKTGRCLSCAQTYTLEWMKQTVHEKKFLKCERRECLKDKSKDDKLKIVKPDIVFFGEAMPKEFFNFEEDFKQCDLLIIMGTSLKVQPFGSIYNHVPEDCPRLLINREVVGEWLEYEENPKLNYRDVALLGDCDNICLKLAEKLGFKKELLKMVDQKQ